MAGDEATIDLASLGEYTPDDQHSLAAEPPKAETKAEPTPEPEPEKAPAPEPEAAAEPEDDDDFEDITLEDIDERIATALKAADPFADDTDAAATVPPEVKKLADENAALRAKVAEQEKASAEAAKSAAIAEMTTAINSTIGRLKMTDAEVTATTDYLVKNPDLARSGMTFEEAATRRFPGIADRAKPAPTVKETAADGSMQMPPSANGAGAPKAFQHVPDRGDYTDVNRHILQSGLAASLGRYT